MRRPVATCLTIFSLAIGSALVDCCARAKLGWAAAIVAMERAVEMADIVEPPVLGDGPQRLAPPPHILARPRQTGPQGELAKGHPKGASEQVAKPSFAQSACDSGLVDANGLAPTSTQ